MQSPEPFAHDAMGFFEWFQWLCTPRLYDLARAGDGQLPVVSEISTAAEIYLQAEGRAAPILMTLIKALDDELNARWVSTEMASF
jgi:uncharacterized protein YqcC (DUF446 family)